jgi:hypothetical protein
MTAVVVMRSLPRQWVFAAGRQLQFPGRWILVGVMVINLNFQAKS